jgi:apolipoprotein D and lipocalin family protein
MLQELFSNLKSRGLSSSLALVGALGAVVSACQTSPGYLKTVPDVDLQRFMGEWHVIASRPTFLETDAHNAKEVYRYDPKSKEIDVTFRFNQDKPDGEIDTIDQTARVYDPITRAHWKISVWWMPVELDYLIIGLAPDYSWTAVGVPNQNYLWIMARDKQMSEDQLQSILKGIAATGYRIDEVKRVPQA